MDDLERLGRQHKRQRRALELTQAMLALAIGDARRLPEPERPSLRAIADATGLSFARIHQIEKESRRD